LFAFLFHLNIQLCLHMRKKLFQFLFVLPLLALAAGCNSELDKASVNGTVSYKNELLKGGRLKLFNARNELVGAASIAPDGTFVATDLPKEELKVTVETAAANGMAHMQSAAPPGTPVIAPQGATAVPVPEKYFKPETTDLTVNAALGSQRVELKLN
jgi:hypothetical protein